MKKLLSAVLVILMCASVFCSCSDSDNYVVMKVGDHNICYDEYRYFYMNFRDTHEARADTDYDETLKQEIEDALREKYAIADYAEECGVELTSDEKSDIKDQVSEYIDSYGGKDSFNATLEGEYLTQDLFTSLLESQLLEEDLREYECSEYTGSILSDDATVEAYIYEHFIHATQILIANDENEDIVANKALADELYQRAVDGEDFDSLITEYNEDSYMNGSTVGYYFVSGQLLAEFEDAATALEIGEISEVVPSYLGWHIIKRLPLDEDYINDNFENLRTTYKNKIFNDNVEAKAEKLAVVYTEYYKEITDSMLVNNIKKAD